tara:strand:- start:1383 stop:1667 length:285 start_codon:yes stop_codon:yes gene_type:complete
MMHHPRQNYEVFSGEVMLPLNPFCLINAGKIAGLKTTIIILMTMLMKSKLLRVKMSLLGSLIGFTLLVGFLITTGVLTIVAGGALVYASQKQND